MPAAITGPYFIDPDGAGDIEPLPVTCDMDADGGGWMRLKLNHSNQLLVAEYMASNPWKKCADDAAKFFDWISESQVTADYSPNITYVKEIPVTFLNPGTDVEYSPEQMAVLRGLVTQLSQTTRMVAVTADDDGYSYQDNQNGGHEVYVMGTPGQWDVLSPGTNQECGNSSDWPHGGSQSAFYLWSTDAAQSQVSGTTGISSDDLGALPQANILPLQVRLVVYTGGGVAFGWEKQEFLTK